MEVPMLRTIMVLLHLPHTPTVFYQDQWADVVPSRAPLAALGGCCSMLMGPQGFLQRKARTTREVNLTLSRINRGEYFLLPPLLHARVVFHQQVLEAARP